MTKQSNSTAALNDILYQTTKTMKAFIAISDIGSDDSDSEGQDCKTVESLHNCDKNEAHNDEIRLQNTSSTSAVMLLNVLKAPMQSYLVENN